MKIVITLIIIHLSFFSFSQAGPGKKKSGQGKKPKIEVVTEERKIRRNELMEASTVKDIIIGIPPECIIARCELLSTAENGRFLGNGISSTGNDIQKLIKAKDAKIIYVDIDTSCKPKLSYKVIITDD